MDAMVSGQCGVAVMIRGNSTTIMDIQAEYELPCPHTSVPLLLHDVPDVVQLYDTDQIEVAKSLKKHYACDTALQLTLILLDRNEDIHTRTDAAEVLNDILESTEPNDFIANRLYGAPLPDGTDLDTVWLQFAEFGRVTDLLFDVATKQEEIREFSEAWKRVPLELFGDLHSKDACRETLIQLGTIRSLIQALQDRGAFDAARLKSHRELQSVPQSRQILRTWLEEFVPERVRPLPVEDMRDESSRTEGVAKKGDHPRLSRADAIAYAIRMRQAADNVARQKEEIMDHANKGSWGSVDKYTKQLVKFQLQNGGPEFASKSLCHLAQHAKSLHNHSRQLEFAEWAARLKSDDGWAHGQVADAYICLGQFDNAMRALDKAEEHGEERFVATERGWILRRQAKLDEAIKAFQNAKESFPEEPFAWYGYAEVLRDMWRPNDALAAYEAAAERFPYERSAQCGVAAVLTDLGDLDRALEVYRDVFARLGRDVVSASGYANVLAKMGRLQEALMAYEDTIRDFPFEPSPRCGHANVLREMGDLERSLAEYDVIVSDFQHEPIAICGRAEILKAMGRLDDSLDCYQEAKGRFPWVSWVWNGYASVLKKSCKFEESLQSYDQAVNRFPYDVVAMSGRADLLKELGMLEDGIAAYEQLLDVTQNKTATLHSMASIMVAQEKYVEALALLGEERTPRTRDEWIAFHIRGMILLRTGKINEAISHLEFGYESCPFASERRYFGGALAVARLSLNLYYDAADLVEEDRTPFANLIRIHAFGALEDFAKAEEAYEQVKNRCPPLLEPLRDALVAQYLASALVVSHSADWIFKQECACAVLAAA